MCIVTRIHWILFSISQNQASQNFFGVIQALYNFIAGSSKRHDSSNFEDTKWYQVGACHINALRSLNTALSAIMDTLEAVADSETDSRIVAEANGLLVSVN